MAAYGDIGPGYIGTAESYSYGPKCYETGAPSRVSAGSAPLLLQGMQSLLEKAAAAAGAPADTAAAGNARIQNVGKYQSCMVSKLPWWQEQEQEG